MTSFVKVKEPTDTTTRHSRVYIVIYFTLLELGHLQTVYMCTVTYTVYMCTVTYYSVHVYSDLLQ